MKKVWISAFISLLVVGMVLLSVAVGNPANSSRGPSFTPQGHLLASEAASRKIVVFTPGVSEARMRGIVESEGAAVIKPLPLINALVITFPPLPPQAADKAREAILAHAPIVRIDDDLVMEALPKPPAPPGKEKKPKPPPEQPEQTLPWGVDRIDADLAWGTSTGSGVNVAIMDTGIDLEHPDLSVAGGINIINPRKSAKDDNGHGTHVAGIAAALDNEIGVVGVAPQASLYAVKVLDRKGNGWLSDVIDGLTWCIKNNMQIINMSFGSTADNQSFREAISAVYNAGITQVAAAGNDSSGIRYPAKYSETIAVSASGGTATGDDYFAYWSNYGPEVDFIAPGVDINSTYKGGEYKVLSGTSMSAPHVTGTAALLLQINPSFPPDLAGEPLSGLSSDQQGEGLIDAEASVK